MTAVKICGLTTLEAGAGMLGFVLAPSRRQVKPEAVAYIVRWCRTRFPREQRPWQAVGVFVNEPLDSGSAGSWGGTGVPFQWDRMAGAAGECIVAGG